MNHQNNEREERITAISHFKEVVKHYPTSETMIPRNLCTGLMENYAQIKVKEEKERITNILKSMKQDIYDTHINVETAIDLIKKIEG